MSTRKKRSRARRRLEKLAGGQLTLGDLLVAIREGEGKTQAALADRLEVSRSHLCDIEKGRKTVSPARAARFAEILGFGQAQFVRLALQGQVEVSGLSLEVHVEGA